MRTQTYKVHSTITFGYFFMHEYQLYNEFMRLHEATLCIHTVHGMRFLSYSFEIQFMSFQIMHLLSNSNFSHFFEHQF